MRLLGLSLVALLWAGTAQAATRVCSAEAKGPGGSRVSVNFHIENGRTIESNANWSPPSDAAGPFPMLHVFYDLGSDALGAPAALRVAGYVEVTPAPASNTAEILVTLDDGKSWRRPWMMFAQHAAELKRPGAQPVPLKDGKPVGFFGSIPIAMRSPSEGPPTNVDLLDGLPAAKTLDVRIEGDAGETFGVKRFDLSDLTERDRLLRDAWGRAAEAAKTPNTCKEAAD